MAYTPIDKGENFFNTKLYTGNGGTNAQTGVGFAPNWTWIKNRSGTDNHALYDIIRGTNKVLRSNNTNAEGSQSDGLTAFGTDGFTVGADGAVNTNGNSFVAWNWIGANPPKKTYVVKVVSDGGNKYRLDDFAANAVTLELSEGGTFIFDQSDSSNNGHPLRFSTTSNGTHGGGSIYTTGVVVSGTPGQAGAKTTITVAASAPTLYYFCTVHSGMGGQANTPTTNSFTNLDGSIQSNVSPNTISKFSIVKFTGTGANATVGHGLGFVPKMIIFKNLPQTEGWIVYHQAISNTHFLPLNTDGALVDNATMFNDTSPTGSVFSVGSNHGTNGPNHAMIAYCFGDVQGFSKMGSYVGNGNVDGTFVYTGFKPAFIFIRRTTPGTSWQIQDNKRLGYNVNESNLFPDTNGAEAGGKGLDILSNGFKARSTSGANNSSGNTFIYMAFAENPFTSSAGTPVTAR